MMGKMRRLSGLLRVVWGSGLIKKIIQLCIVRCTVLHILYAFYSEVIKGYYTYRNIKRKTSGAKIFLQYYQGTGDVYLSSAYLKYCEQKQKKIKNSVFAVNGANAYRVAALMGLKDVPIVKLSEREAYSLVHLSRFIGQSNVDITYLHYMSDYPMYTCFFITLAGLHGLGFMDLYREIAFEGEVFEMPTPQWNKGERVASKEKKVLLAPVANSIAEGPSNLFWCELAKELKVLGYEVYTNISAEEQPVEGTKPIFIPYGDLASFLDKDAVLIGYRSGLCDLIASLQCKKIILYPDSCWPVNDGLGIGSTLDIFSLNNMGICEDVIELVYNMKNERDMISEILRGVTSCREERLNT